MTKGAAIGIIAVLAVIGLAHAWLYGGSLAALAPTGLLLALLIPAARA